MNKKQTSKKVATKASKILGDSRYGSKAKSVAGSALAQTKSSKRKQSTIHGWILVPELISILQQITQCLEMAIKDGEYRENR